MKSITHSLINSTIIFIISSSYFYSSNCNGETNKSSHTLIMQTPGLNNEGTHTTMVSTEVTIEQASLAFRKLYGEENSDKSQLELPTVIVWVPESMEDAERMLFLKELEAQFESHGAPEVHFLIEPLKIPTNLLVNGKEKIKLDSKSKKNYSAWASEFQKWSDYMLHWRDWIKSSKNKWNSLTAKEKDKATLIGFGVGRGIPGIFVYYFDAGLTAVNIFRMALAYSADIFFSVAPQKLASIPEKINIPSFPSIKDNTVNIVSLASAVGLNSIGINEYTNPNLIFQQLSYGAQSFRDWINRSTEIKSFLFNYTLSLVIPLTFLSLGYFSKDASSPDVLDPFELSFLLSFAGKQVLDGVMGTLGGRGGRVLAQKRILSGRTENIYYSALNVLGQIQGLGIATGHPFIYDIFLGIKSLIQACTFLTSRVLITKSPLFVVAHESIPDKVVESELYMKGLVNTVQFKHVEEALNSIDSFDSGLSGFNQKFAEAGIYLNHRIIQPLKRSIQPLNVFWVEKILKKSNETLQCTGVFAN